MPLVDPSGPQWIKELSTTVREQRRQKSGIAAFFDRLFNAMFGWLR